jgi:hypothetical protein
MPSRLRNLYLTLEIWGIRCRGWLRTGMRAFALAIVLLGGYNLLAAPLVGEAFLSEYRSLWSAMYLAENSAYYLADLLILVLGTIVAWFV